LTPWALACLLALAVPVWGYTEGSISRVSTSRIGRVRCNTHGRIDSTKRRMVAGSGGWKRRGVGLGLIGSLGLSGVKKFGGGEALADEDEEARFFDFDEGHLAILLPGGYLEVAEVQKAPEEKKVVPGYLLTPDAAQQEEVKKKSVVRLRKEGTDSNIVFSTTPASSFKIMFTRVNDISDYGSVQDVGKFILPSKLKDLKYDVRKEVFPIRQTARGPMTPPPRNYYRYEFVTDDGLDHLVLMLVALKGFIYTMTITCPEKFWGTEGREIIASTDTMTLA